MLRIHVCFLYRVVNNSLELTEIAICMFPKELDVDTGLEMATDIYLENYAPFMGPSRSLMSAILTNRVAYYEHRVS